MGSSPLIQRTEALYDLPQALSNLGYDSVFDVVAMPRERFVRQHRAALGRNAGRMYDLVIGYALQVLGRFRHNKSPGAANMTPHGPFTRSGPDYAHQFLDGQIGWKNRAPRGSPEANDGPVAYLAYIYGLALQEEQAVTSAAMNTLKQRRPDIGSLSVDDAAINQQVPQIQLVNEILASAIQSVQNLSDVDAVNALLATTRYPNVLPYHYANEQICTAQSVLGVDLADELWALDMSLFQGFWSPRTNLNDTQAGDLVRLQILSSRLAPEQQTILTEAPYFGHYHLVLADLYDSSNSGKFWQGCSVNDLFIHAYLVTGAFILPLQDGVVVDYDGRPAQLVYDSNGVLRGKTPLNIIMTDGSDTRTVTFQSWHIVGDASPVPVNVIKPPSLPTDYLCLSYAPSDNGGLDFSQTTYQAGFSLTFSIEAVQPDKGRDITISLHLSVDPYSRYSGAQKQFYADNFGDATLSVSSFQSMDVLTSRTGLTVPEVERMLCATAGGETAFTVVVSENYTPRDTLYVLGSTQYPTVATPFFYGARYIHAGLEPCIYLTKAADESLQVIALTDDRLDRINRMVRLQKWLGMSYEDIDLLVTSTIAAEGTGNPAFLMTDSTLRMVGIFRRYQQLHGASAKQFAAWLYLITPFAITPEKPFLDQVFNSTGAFDTPLVTNNLDLFDPNATSGADAEIVQKICASLGIGRQEFLMMAPDVRTNYPYDNVVADQDQLKCDLFVLSSFYRVASLARALGMRVRDFYTLARLFDQGSNTIIKQLTGLPVITAPQTGAPLAGDFLSVLLAFSHVALWLQKRQLPVAAVAAMVTPVAESAVYPTDYKVSFVREVCQQLANTCVDATLFRRSGAPLYDDNQTPIDWMALLAYGKLIDYAGLVSDAADDTVAVQIDGSSTPVIQLIHDAVNAQALTDAEKLQAMAALNGAVVQARQTQAGVAISLLAKTLDLAQSFSVPILRWAGQTPYTWLALTWGMRLTTQLGDDWPSHYLMILGEIGRRGMLCRQFSMTSTALRYLLDHPEQFGLPSSYDGEVDFSTLYLLGRYEDLLYAVGAAGGGTEDDILAYLQLLNGGSLDSDEATALAVKLLGWEQQAVEDSWALLGGPAKTLPQLDALMRLQQTERDTGLSVSQQQQGFGLDRDSGYDVWQAVGQAMVTGVHRVKS